MKTLKVCAMMFGVLGLAGCAASSQVAVHPVSTQHYPPTSVVETFMKVPTRPYVVLADLHASAPAGSSSAQVIASIEKQAAALGADAVILHNDSRSTPAQVQFNSSGGNYQTLPPQITPIYSGEAIRWISKDKMSGLPQSGR